MLSSRNNTEIANKRLYTLTESSLRIMVNLISGKFAKKTVRDGFVFTDEKERIIFSDK